MTIQLQFSARNDIGSELIKVFERGWASHVDAVLPDGRLLGARSDEVAGQPKGVQVRPPNYAAFNKTRVYALPCSPSVDDAWLAFLNAQIGKPYDMTAIAAFAFERNWQEDDSWFCSELQTAALDKVFFPRPVSEGANFITPRDCELMISPWATLVASTGF